MAAKEKKLDPILGWNVVDTRDPIGRPILRAVNPEGGPRDYIEAGHHETEDSLLLSREAIERAILRENVRLAKSEKERASAQKDLDDFVAELTVIRRTRSELAARRAILEK